MSRNTSTSTTKGRRKASTSPTNASTTIHSPSSSPKLKLALRPITPRQTRTNGTHPQAKTRSKASEQRAGSSSLGTPLSHAYDDDSDLTPQSSDNDEDDGADLPEPSTRKGKHEESTPTRRSSAIGVEKKGTKGKEKETPTPTKKNITATGPQGRDRKKLLKAGDSERRRARDEKFSMDESRGSGNVNIASTNHDADADDGASSYGDDESDHAGPHADLEEEELQSWLPEAFAGQDIEDLAYGAGPAEFHIQQQVIGGWSPDHDEDEDEEEEEREPAQIDDLSGSEADRQSQSSVAASESDVGMSDSDFSSSSEDELDEFGFPIAPVDTAILPSGDSPAADGPLILMENWDGQFVLVQPRNERSRSRKGDRGSRTAGSTGGSTVISSGDQNQLMIDEDAEQREFESDTSSWSGLSDEEDDGGDTTDSMAEEDMPMLDSPALQQLMSEQIGQLDMSTDLDSPLAQLLADPTMTTPSIVITDTSLPNPETPALSTTSTASGVAGTAAVPPATPQSAPLPFMGTFHPATDDPAQHAVIDGSGQATKSPFTHRKKTVTRGRTESFASSRTTMTRDDRDRKRKSSVDIFSSPKLPAVPKLSKKARFSSIPGHPRYIRARRAAEAVTDADRETTPSDSDINGADAFSLEDMLESSVLMHEYESTHPHSHGHTTPGGAAGDDHLRHLIRFDRIPVSTYLRRNFLSSAGRVETTYHEEYIQHHQQDHQQAFSSPLGRSSQNHMGYMNMTLGMTDTLAGPLGGRGMLISPILEPVGEDTGDGEDEGHHGLVTSRKERRRAKRRNILPIAPLQI